MYRRVRFEILRRQFCQIAVPQEKESVVTCFHPICGNIALYSINPAEVEDFPKMVLATTNSTVKNLCLG